MPYGTDAGVMALTYGGSKSTVPSIITTARGNATSLINGFLNITEDLNPVPIIVDNACNWIASEFCKNPTPPAKDLIEMADTLLGTIKDQLSSPSSGRWANIKFV